MSAEAESAMPWYYRPVWIAVLALLVLGPLAIPLIWRSPAFGTVGRWVATLLILVYSVVLVWQTIVATQLLMMQLQMQ